MSKWKKVLSGIIALIIVLGVAMPMRAFAEDADYHHRGHHPEYGARDQDYRRYDHAWRWHWNQDHYSGYIPANGEGMLNPRNPNLYWACDSEGHHCHWAPRY
ncbi:MAG: hypothetical protein ABSC63_06185 [Candidatus Binataceae bacterium]|jgi:hypothetical protein